MTDPLLHEIACAFDIDPTAMAEAPFRIVGDDALPSFFGVSSLAAKSIGMAGAMLWQFASGEASDPAAVIVDQRLASLWFGLSLRPIGWTLSPTWDSVAGDYRAKDGWIRLHTNAPHHRKRAMAVLGVVEDREAVARAVAKWDAEALERAVVEAGGCAAMMRSFERWAAHPQGADVGKQPLIIWDEHNAITPKPMASDQQRPLQGLRVLDLTRVLAGPAATRFLASFGAEVLRIDPPDWDETVAVQEMTLGKRCARLDLKIEDDRAVFEEILAGADMLVHGYRAEALAGLGYGRDQRRALNPGLIDVSLNAYGWSGPWSDRRGFDSLVQMSSGLADYGMNKAAADRPFPLPVQALDHATGYLMAAAVLRALALRQREGRVLSARLSLARTARLLANTKRETLSDGWRAETDDDVDRRLEETVWGSARRVKFSLSIEGFEPNWPHPAGPLGTSAPAWA
ncbi:MAG: CoA transferase [Geminicoccaceae bacterium]